jgi:hypothetical protein
VHDTAVLPFNASSNTVVKPSQDNQKAATKSVSNLLKLNTHTAQVALTQARK